MRKIKDILRLRYEAKLSYRGIAQALNIGYGTVVDYLNRAEQAQLDWPLPADLLERDLGRRLFPTQAATGQRRFVEPDFSVIYQELKRKGVTKLLLWQEYRQLCMPGRTSIRAYCFFYYSVVAIFRRLRMKCFVHIAACFSYFTYTAARIP